MKVAALLCACLLLVACGGSPGTHTTAADSTRHLTVVFIGDSRVEQWDLATSFSAEHYINKGVSGESTSQILARFDRDVVQLHPDAVVILAGTAGMFSDGALAQAESDIPAMLQAALDAHIAPIVCSVPPTAATDWKPRNDEIAKLNSFLKVAYPTSTVRLADLYPPMVAADGYIKDGLTLDGVHFNAAGYAIIAPLVQQQISALAH